MKFVVGLSDSPTFRSMALISHYVIFETEIYREDVHVCIFGLDILLVTSANHLDYYFYFWWPNHNQFTMTTNWRNTPKSVFIP